MPKDVKRKKPSEIGFRITMRDSQGRVRYDEYINHPKTGITTIEQVGKYAHEKVQAKQFDVIVRVQIDIALDDPCPA